MEIDSNFKLDEQYIRDYESLAAIDLSIGDFNCRLLAPSIALAFSSETAFNCIPEEQYASDDDLHSRVDWASSFQIGGHAKICYERSARLISAPSSKTSASATTTHSRRRGGLELQDIWAALQEIDSSARSASSSERV